MNFFNLNQEAFGLDISNLSLKIMKLEKKRKMIKLASFGEFSLPRGIIEGGEIRDVKALSQILKEAKKRVKGKKIKTRYVVASLPEEKAFSQVIQLPKMELHEVKKAVYYEAENYIPLPISEVYLDCQIIPPLYNHLEHLDVLIAALPKRIVDPYVEVLKRAGFIPKVLEIEPFAITRAIVKNGISKRPLLLIDLGATKTSFIIFSGFAIRFTSSIPVSGQIFTTSIAKELNVSFQEAEKLKIRYGLGGPKQVKLFLKKSDGIEFKRVITRGQRIFDALVPPLIDLIEQIKTYLNYYLTHVSHEHLPPNHKGIQKILLSGGGANLKRLIEFLEEKFKVPIHLANPWVNILPPPLKNPPELSFEDSLRYTTAIGLALRGLE